MWSAPQVTASDVEPPTSSVYANHVAAAYTGFMRNPFRKAPMQQLETTIVSLAKRGEQLVAKRVTAQAALDSGNSGPPGYSPVGGPRRSTGARQAAGCRGRGNPRTSRASTTPSPFSRTRRRKASVSSLRKASVLSVLRQQTSWQSR